MKAENVPLLVAHRGDMDRHPENSWSALRAAVNAGACWLEFDVQQCADGRFVLLHDADFQRTAGNPQRVFDLDADACRSISVHYPRRFGSRFEPEPAPLLDEVLSWLSTLPDVRAMVEIKGESLKHFGLAPVMDALLATLAPHAAQCVLISFDDAALAFAARRRVLQTGWVLPRFDAAHRERAQRLRPHYLICNRKKIPRHGRLWDGDWQWMLYDIRHPRLALAWARRGAGLVESGDITRMLSHPRLAERACRHGL